MYFYCFFSFEYFDSYDHYAACWDTLKHLLRNRPAGGRDEYIVTSGIPPGVPYIAIVELPS